MTTLKRTYIFLGAVLAAMLPARASLPAGPAAPENEVRAAVIANFVNFVEWPYNARATGETLICVAGRGPTVDALLTLNGKSVYGRTVGVVSRVNAADSGDCRIFFIGEGSAHAAANWLRDLAGQPILTVSEGEDFLPNGGIVSLNRSGQRIVFDVNLAAMRQAKLKIASDLLRLAREVHGK